MKFRYTLTLALLCFVVYSILLGPLEPQLLLSAAAHELSVRSRPVLQMRKLRCRETRGWVGRGAKGLELCNWSELGFMCDFRSSVRWLRDAIPEGCHECEIDLRAYMLGK